MTKLHILRALLTAALWAAYLLRQQDRYLWLLHYLRGTGETLWVKEEHLLALLPTLKREWDWALEHPDCEGSTLVKSVHTRRGSFIDRVGFWSTTLYEGRGFGSRPELFYILGCFTFTVRHDRDAAQGGYVVTVEGADRYDWHATPEGEYYTSPTARWAVALAGLVFGREYFPLQGFPMGEPGISNRLWADLEKVGARPFKTRFRAVVPEAAWEAAWQEADSYNH